MFSSLSLAVLASLAPVAGVPPPPKGTQVEVSAGALRLPELPDSVKAAHSKYGDLRPVLKEELDDLDKELAMLYAMPGAQEVLPDSLRVPMGKADEARYLNTMLVDHTFLELERPVVEAWNTWANALLLTYLAKSDGAPKQAITAEAIGKARVIITSLQRQQSSANDFYIPENVRNNQPINQRITGYDQTALDAHGMRAYTNNQHEEYWTYIQNATRSMHAVKVANREAPALAARWRPLAEHLNACARKLVDYELATTPTEHVGLQRLRLRAKIEFLERFRSTLWFSYLVWAHLASDEPPAPMKKLGG